MATEKLYFKDAYLREFNAVITDIYEKKGKTAVVLDQTVFFPEGGGQAADHGTLTSEDGTVYKVIDVQEKGDDAEHIISTPIEKTNLKTGDHVSGLIDWDRRFDLMQQHSGEHIVSGMICSTFHCDNVGFHLGDEIVTIDFNTKLTMEDALKIEEQANRYIRENHDFVSLWPDSEELKNIEYRSKKELTGPVRIASFPGADTCACCGTHVSTSSQVGLVKFTSAESFHGGTRLTLRCGKRAFDFLAANYSQNKAIGVLLSTKEEKTYDAVKKLSDELASVRYELTRLQEEQLDTIAGRYKDNGSTLLITSSLAPDMVRKLADKIKTVCGGRASVFAGNDSDGYKYAVCGEPDDVTALNKKIVSELSGRGGGRNGFAQGSVCASADAIRLLLGTEVF